MEHGLPLPGYANQAFTPAARPVVEQPSPVALPSFTPEQQKANLALIAGHFAMHYNVEFGIPGGLWSLPDKALALVPLNRDAGVLREYMTALMDRRQNSVDLGPGTPSLTLAHVANATGASPAQLRALLPPQNGSTVRGEILWRKTLDLGKLIHNKT